MDGNLGNGITRFLEKFCAIYLEFIGPTCFQIKGTQPTEYLANIDYVFSSQLVFKATQSELDK